MINVLVVGPDIGGKGGIASVINTYCTGVVTHRVIELKTYKTGNGKKNLFLFMVSMFRLMFLCIFKDVDVVYIHTASKGSFFRKSLILHISRLLNKPTILHLHGGGFKDFYLNSHKFIQKYIKYSIESASRFVVLSDSWKSWFKFNSFNVGRFDVVHNGVSHSSSENKTYKLNKIVYAGRLVEGKGIEDLIKVYAKIVEEHPSVDLYIAGTGNLEHYQKIVASYNLVSKVHFCGWVSRIELDKLLNGARCLVLPSYAEGMPMCILESFSNKTPVVVTNVGSIPEVVEHDYNGFIIEPGNLTDLYKFISAYCIDDDLCFEHGENAYLKFTKHFSSKVFVTKTDNVIEKAFKKDYPEI